MAVAGDALTGRHVTCRYSAQSAQGTPVTAATSAGLVSYEMTSDSGMMEVMSIGNANAKFLKPGLSQVNLNLNWHGVQTKAVLELAERASGLLPFLTFEFGINYDSGTDYGYQVQDAKLHNLDISLEAGGLLTASASGVGGLITDITSVAHTNLTETPFAWYEGVMTRGGAAFIVRTFRMTVDHSVVVEPRIHGAAPATFKRGWSYQTEGFEHISGEIVRFDRTGVDMQAGTMASSDLVLTMTDIAGGGSPTTIVITITGAKLGAETYVGELDGVALFRVPFMGTGFTIS